MDRIVFHQIFVAEEYAVPPSILSQIGAPDVIFDLGANVGYATVYFTLQYPNAHVFAVEPSLSNFIVLQDNTKVLSNVEVIRGAVWDVDGHVKGSDQFRDGESWSFSVIDGDGDGEIPAYSVGNLLSRCKSGGPVWIKIDIEGAETKLFTSNTAWLECVDLLWIEIHPDSMFGDSSPYIQLAADKHGFNVYASSETTILYKVR
jgi:FkbM family methyltransferase